MLDHPVYYDRDELTARLSQGLPDTLQVIVPSSPLRGGDHLQFSLKDQNQRCAASMYFTTGLNLKGPCQLTHANAFEPAAPYKGLNTILLHNITMWMAEIGFSHMTVDTIDFGCYVWAHFFSIDAHRYDPSGELVDLIEADLYAIQHKLPEKDYREVEGIVQGLRHDDAHTFHRLVDMGLSVCYDNADRRDFANLRLDELAGDAGLSSIPLALYLLHWRPWSGEMAMGQGVEQDRLAAKASQYSAYNARLTL